MALKRSPPACVRIFEPLTDSNGKCNYGVCPSSVMLFLEKPRQESLVGAMLVRDRAIFANPCGE